MQEARALHGLSRHFRVQLLGSFGLFVDGRRIEVERWQRRPGALLRMLAAMRDGRLPRDEVADRFWPESPPRAAASNLRYVLFLLRRDLIADPPPVIVDGAWVLLNPIHRWDIDLAALRETVGMEPVDFAAAVQSLGIHAGELLPEDRYDDWATSIRSEVYELQRAALLRLTDEARRRGTPGAVLHLLDQYVARDPLDEALTESLIRALFAVGRRVDAVRTFRTFECSLREELDLDPPDTMRRLIATSGARMALLQDGVPDPAMGNAPIPVTSGTPDWLHACGAGDRAMSGLAFAEAEGHYRTALEVAVGDEEKARAGEKLGTVLSHVGRYSTALDVLSEAEVSYHAAGNVTGATRAAAVIGITYVLAGKAKAGTYRIEQALNSAAAGPERAALLQTYATLLHEQARFDAMLPITAQVIETARACGLDGLTIVGEMDRADCLDHLGRLEEGEQIIVSALPHAESLGDPVVLRRVFQEMTTNSWQQGKLSVSRHYGGRALEIAELQGDPSKVSLHCATLGRILYFSGEWDPACHYLYRARSLRQSISSSTVYYAPERVMARIAYDRGEMDEARAWVERGRSLIEQTGNADLLRTINAFLALIELESRGPKVALELLDQCGTEYLSEGDGTTFQARVLCYLAIGDLKQALACAQTLIERDTNRVYRPDNVRLRGQCEAAAGRYISALHLFDDALSVARAIGIPLSIGETLVERSKVLQAIGRSTQGEQNRVEALRLFRQLGAKRALRHAGNLVMD